MYETILVPTDGSDHAVRAAEHAGSLAAAFDATVHVIHVVDVNAAAGPFSAGGVDDEFLARLEAGGEEAIEAVEPAVAGAADLRTATVRGRPSTAIGDYADDHGADLIAMGTHGRTGLQRVVTGSVTERVLRRASVPVLTARATDESAAADGYDDILIPTDGSGLAEAAAGHAVGLAARFDATVHAVNIVDLGEAAATPNYEPPTDLVERLEDAGESATGRVAARAREAGIEAVTAVREGFPARTLLEYADDAGIDLIAMGTAGRSGVAERVLGSTTERVLRRAPVPVLTVGPDAVSD
jgi:nucleotide-binding universal stress UspA family protein